MQDQTQRNERQFNLTVDLGGGKQVDVELLTSDQLWVSAGPRIGGSDVWMKADDRLIDLRVRIRRTVGGVEIVVDRGDTQDLWWPPGGAPRLAVAIDPSARTALAVASSGTDGEFQEVMLGKTAI
jgi:hypothetical protein